MFTKELYIKANFSSSLREYNMAWEKKRIQVRQKGFIINASRDLEQSA